MAETAGITSHTLERRLRFALQRIKQSLFWPVVTAANMSAELERAGVLSTLDKILEGVAGDKALLVAVLRTETSAPSTLSGQPSATR